MMNAMRWIKFGFVGTLVAAGCADTATFEVSEDHMTLRVACSSDVAEAVHLDTLTDELTTRGFEMTAQHCDAPVNAWRDEDVVRTLRFARGEDTARITIEQGVARADMLVMGSAGRQLVPLQVDGDVVRLGKEASLDAWMAQRAAEDELDAIPWTAETAAVSRFFGAERWVGVTLDPNLIRDDGVVTVLAEVHPTVYLAMEFTLDSPWAVQELQFDPSTMRQILAPVGLNGVDIVSRHALADRLTAAPEDFDSFCSDNEGGGVLAVGQMDVMLDGEPATVRVDLRRDVEFQSLGTSASVESLAPTQRTSIGSAPSRPAADVQAVDGDMVWVISWFSRDCGRVRVDNPTVFGHSLSVEQDHESAMSGAAAVSRRCNVGTSCSVTLASLIELADQLGIDVPADATVEMLLELLPVEVGGRCNEVYLLGLVYVGCQCVMYTF